MQDTQPKYTNHIQALKTTVVHCRGI